MHIHQSFSIYGSDMLCLHKTKLNVIHPTYSPRLFSFLSCTRSLHPHAKMQWRTPVISKLKIVDSFSFKRRFVCTKSLLPPPRRIFFKKYKTLLTFNKKQIRSREVLYKTKFNLCNTTWFQLFWRKWSVIVMIRFYKIYNTGSTSKIPIISRLNQENVVFNKVLEIVKYVIIGSFESEEIL